MYLDNLLKKAAFIDRDGVVNDLVDRGEGFCLGGKPFRYTAPFRFDELRLKPYAKEALDLIGQKGYLRILVTNQPDVATGNMSQGEFERIMAAVHAFPLDDIYVCMHHPKEKCLCRKPAPGMLLDAKDKHCIDMSLSYMIGDSETDIQAGRTAGVQTILIANEISLTTNAHSQAMSLLEAARLLP